MTSSPGTQFIGVVILWVIVSNVLCDKERPERGFIPVLVTSLQRVDNPQDLIGVTASRGGVRKDETNSFLGVNDEDGADGECNALGIDVGGVLVVNPVCWK